MNIVANQLPIEKRLAAAIDRTPPASDWRERCVLRSVLIDDGQRPELLGRLTPADFAYWPHPELFKAVGKLHRAGRAVDVVAVAKVNGDLSPACLGALADCLTNGGSGSPEFVRRYTADLRRHAVARRGLAVAATLADNLQHDVPAALAAGHKAIGGLLAELRLADDDRPRETLQFVAGPRRRKTG